MAVVGVRAVVFDIGGVLERVDDDAWPALWIDRWERRMRVPAGRVAAAIAEHAPPEALANGAVSEAELKAGLTAVLGLGANEADQMLAEMWDAYCGELDDDMRNFAAGLRPRYKTGILSNSVDGARREEQRRYGFADLVDVLVYSHEVGVSKPDPAVFHLTEERLGVHGPDVVFIDDNAGHVAAASEHGWRAVHHRDTPQTIEVVTRLLES